MISIINQLFEIEQKLQAKGETIADRNFKRIFHELETLGYQIINPMSRKYTETDTDLEATISGTATANLQVTKVFKPIIYQKTVAAELLLIQKGVVIVE